MLNLLSGFHVIMYSTKQTKEFEMNNRMITTEYKGITLVAFRGSNWIYVGDRIFKSHLAAKRHITKMLSYFNGDLNQTKSFYRNYN